jgi:hypothetical protein
MKLKRLSLLTALALALVAYSAVPASADILSPGEFGSVYQGAVKGVNTGDDPTLTAGSTVITCQNALTEGTMDGDATASGPANAVLAFSWANCATNGAVECTVDPITGVDVAITEENAPSATIRNTGKDGVPGDPAGTTITCGTVFTCNASSDPDTTQVSAEVDQATQVATINDTVAVTGLVGCPLSGTGQWEAQYLITDDLDQDLDLWATGTL